MRIVFDLDGTLSNDEHRAHYLTGDKKDWDAYFDACDGDMPHTHIVTVLKALSHQGHDIEIWTGRSERVRDKTIAWLAEQGITVYPPPGLATRGVETLRMRPEGDLRPDTVLKHEWLEQARERGEAPDLAFDDRDRVVEMWRAAGIPCCQVAPGKF